MHFYIYLCASVFLCGLDLFCIFWFLDEVLFTSCSLRRLFGSMTFFWVEFSLNPLSTNLWSLHYCYFLGVYQGSCTSLLNSYILVFCWRWWAKGLPYSLLTATARHLRLGSGIGFHLLLLLKTGMSEAEAGAQWTSQKSCHCPQIFYGYGTLTWKVGKSGKKAPSSPFMKMATLFLPRNGFNHLPYFLILLPEMWEMKS